uniref:Cytochrome P450 n=1 Tax=Scoparia dulcis TaxID=107240 RepID=A0A1W7HBV8_SCODU
MSKKISKIFEPMHNHRYNEILMYTGTLFAIFFLIFFRYFLAKERKKSLPTNYPVLGMMPGLLLNASRIYDYATEVMELSEGTFLFKGPWFSNMDMLVTSDPANVQYILSKNFHNFPKGPEFKKIFDVLGDGIFIADAESWENQRKLIMSLLKNLDFQKSVGESTWSKVKSGLIPILESVSAMGTELDLQEMFQRLTFDCSCVLVLGHDPNSLCLEFPHLPEEKAFTFAEEAVLRRHILPESLWKLQKWLKIGKEGKLSECKEIIDQYLSNCISLKKKSFKEEEDFDLLSSYMRLLAHENAPEISEEVWRDTMLNLLFAGKDTISATLTWFFWLLATNPEEEKKIRQEILENLRMSEVGKWEFSNMNELNGLIRLHGGLCESLRLFPPIGLQHKAPLNPDILPSGHPISPNVKTVLSFYSMGRLESIWGQNCLEFKPERWISETGGIKTEPSFKFIAFNAGPRSCLGKEMSFVQMKIVATAVMNRFHIQVVEDHPVSPRTSVVLQMKHGLKVKVSKK